MKIAFDVDGVLTYLEEYQLRKGKKYFGENRDIDLEKYDIKDIFKCSKEERNKFWTKYIWTYCLKEPIRQDAKKVIDKLRSEGNEIYIITGRAHTTEDNSRGKIFRKMLEYWLKKNKIAYDGIFYCSEENSSTEKFDICKKIGIDIMVEDKKENIDMISKIANIVCINTKYNQDVKEDNKIRKTTNLWDTYKIIKSFSRNDTFKPLNTEEKINLTSNQKKEYFDNLCSYYKSLPYDKEEQKKLENNYIKSIKIGLPFFKLLYKPIIINKEKIPNENGLIYVSNHLGSLDQFPIMCAIGTKPIHFLASSTLLPLKRGLLYRKTGSIFVDREDPKSREASKDKMAQYLLNGSNVFIFPEGTRNRTDKFMLEFKLGATALAQSTGATIVPFAVNNNYKINGNKLMVRAGDPMKVLPSDDLVEKTLELRDTIATMIWENMNLEKNIDLMPKKVKKK